MKKKYWLILLVIIIIGIIAFIFYKNSFKNLKIGNNKNSQEIVDYILNTSSYEAQVTVNVTSNKNNNKYILKQTYQNPDKSTQEVIEPSNIEGVKIENDGEKIKIENSRLNLNTILENYNYLGDNSLDLHSFIEDYRKDDKATSEETEKEIIMKARNHIENIYIQNKTLYIDRQTLKPIKMEIKDNKQNTTIYILYNEVKLNNEK